MVQPNLVPLLLVLLLPSQGMAAERQPCRLPAAPQPAADATYKPGQVWAYKTRNGEAASTLTILRVENLPIVGIVLHVRIDGIQFRNCTGGPAPNLIEHAPFTKAAINKSVTRQIKPTADLPDFKAGYDDWLAHCGGVYTLSVAEMVEADDESFNASLGCKT